MPLWISIYLPTLSLDLLFPHEPAKAPAAAVLHKEQVYACTLAAQALGVRTGMRRSTALGLVPGILLAEHNPSAETRYLQQIALGLLQYTPNLAFSGHHAILLDVSASLHLFKGPRALSRRIRSTLNNLAPNARLGMAPTAYGALILASQTQSGRRRVLQKKTLERRLDLLPVDVLPATEAYAEWLQGIGCQTLKQLRTLPRKGLQQRSSPALLQDLDTAYGHVERYFTWFEAPDFFSQRFELTERIEHTHAVLAVSRRLIEQLCGWLQARQMAVNELDFKLHHEKGRHACPPTSFTLRLSEASWLLTDFLTLLDERLRQLTLDAPVIAVELSITDATPRPTASRSLFPEPAQWSHHEHRLVDLLCARLGAENILQARPRADYRPEQANHWVCAANTQPDARPDTDSVPCLPVHSRPFWLLPAPLPLATRNNHPIYQGASLNLIQGPERLESGWWSEPGHELRDYFIAQDQHFARYWVYRQRESLGARWFLHGLFG